MYSRQGVRPSASAYPNNPPSSMASRIGRQPGATLRGAPNLGMLHSTPAYGHGCVDSVGFSPPCGTDMDANRGVPFSGLVRGGASWMGCGSTRRGSMYGDMDAFLPPAVGYPNTMASFGPAGLPEFGSTYLTPMENMCGVAGSLYNTEGGGSFSSVNYRSGGSCCGANNAVDGGSFYDMGHRMGSFHEMDVPMGGAFGAMWSCAEGSVYGSIVDGAARRGQFLARNELVQAECCQRPHQDRPGSKVVKGKVDEPSGMSEAKEMTNADANMKDCGGDMVKPPEDANIHTLVVIAGSPGGSSAAPRKSTATTVTVSGEDFTFDEVLTCAGQSGDLGSTMLHDLRCHWLAGHSSALLVGSTKGEKPSSLRAVGRFISESIAQTERKRVAFTVTVSMAAFKSSAHAMDLFQPGSTHTEVKLGSSPVFGPGIVSVTKRIATTPAGCVKLFEEGMNNLDDAKELVVAFFVLKQVVKGSSGAEAVYLSSLAVVIAGEDPAQLTAVKEKHISVPFTLLRYAVGGGSAAVCLITVPGDGAESSCAKVALGVGASMREVRNSPPRSGNVRNFVMFAESEVRKQKERAGQLDDPERKAALANLVERIEAMLEDAVALLSRPMETEAKIYWFPLERSEF